MEKKNTAQERETKGHDTEHKFGKKKERKRDIELFGSRPTIVKLISMERDWHPDEEKMRRVGAGRPSTTSAQWTAVSQPAPWNEKHLMLPKEAHRTETER